MCGEGVKKDARAARAVDPRPVVSAKPGGHRHRLPELRHVGRSVIIAAAGRRLAGDAHRADGQWIAEGQRESQRLRLG